MTDTPAELRDGRQPVSAITGDAAHTETAPITNARATIDTWRANDECTAAPFVWSPSTPAHSRESGWEPTFRGFLTRDRQIATGVSWLADATGALQQGVRAVDLSGANRTRGWWLIFQHKCGDQRGDLISQFDLREVARPGQHLDGGLGHMGTDQVEPG